MARPSVPPLVCLFVAMRCSLLVPSRASAQRRPAGADYVIHNFNFADGETLPELRIHYVALGQRRRDAKGVVRNAVMVLHGTTGSGASFLSRTRGPR